MHGDKPTAASPAGLKDHKELSAAAFERTRMPMVISDARQPDNPIVLANQAFFQLTGYPADEVIGRNCRFLQGPGTSQTAVAELRHAVAAGLDANVEILNYRKDGSPFWNQLHISPIEDDDGQVAYYFASQIDVTEYRRVQGLEASEHRLLMEVDHRAKNVLAIVDSIVRLSRADDPAVYAASVQQRVRALAQAHGLLAHHAWRPVELREVIDTQAKRYLHANITLGGPSVAVAADVVQPFSLVISELLDNAVAHGSLSKANNGALSIHWGSAPETGGFHLTWEEQGAGLQPVERFKGFGTIVVDALIEKQLGGHVGRNWAPGGLAVDIDVPGKRGQTGGHF